MNRCLDALRTGFDDAEVVYRSGNRIVFRRYETTSGRSLIIKMWSRPDLRGSLRRFLGIASYDREWRALVRLSGVHISVPQPLGFCRIRPSIAGFTEALFTADLGDCEAALNHLKRLIQSGQEKEVLQFEDELIEMTKQILDAGIIDVDHGLVNTVVQASGKQVRLDFELARCVYWPSLFAGMYGDMLGRMIVQHAFAVQPNTERTTRFAERLCKPLHPPKRVLDRARICIRKALNEQLQNTGIDTRITLPWK